MLKTKLPTSFFLAFVQKKKQKKERNYTVVGSCESTLRHRDDI